MPAPGAVIELTNIVMAIVATIVMEQWEQFRFHTHKNSFIYYSLFILCKSMDQVLTTIIKTTIFPKFPQGMHQMLISVAHIYGDV